MLKNLLQPRSCVLLLSFAVIQHIAVAFTSVSSATVGAFVIRRVLGLFIVGFQVVQQVSCSLLVKDSLQRPWDEKVHWKLDI